MNDVELTDQRLLDREAVEIDAIGDVELADALRQLERQEPDIDDAIGREGRHQEGELARRRHQGDRGCERRGEQAPMDLQPVAPLEIEAADQEIEHHDGPVVIALGDAESAQIGPGCRCDDDADRERREEDASAQQAGGDHQGHHDVAVEFGLQRPEVLVDRVRHGIALEDAGQLEADAADDIAEILPEPDVADVVAQRPCRQQRPEHQRREGDRSRNMVPFGPCPSRLTTMRR